ncbi:MAG: Hsp20/alpha crystallin family protein [Chloroflexi bacterium]|nr:MAG: Hsp20/alpha crystallin family protein [Chloroflexota bacterium]TMD83066.1 MAG: Hsp20/alpha crystallin family protein [Chloroflexota bacterium]
MSNVIRWSPITDLMSLHSAMDRLFGDTFGVPGHSRTVGAVGEGYLPLDVYQTDREWVVRAAVPGVDPSTVDVTFDGGQINIKGEIMPPAGIQPESYWLRENFYGKFSRQVTLPEDAVGEQARAQFVNGMLILTVPKAQPAKPKSVKIPISGGTASGNGEQKQIGSTVPAGQKK